MYRPPLTCWCLTIKTQGFSEKKNLSKPEIVLDYIHLQTRFISPQEQCEQVLQNTVQILGLFHCRLLTAFTHLPCFCFQLSQKMREQAGMTLQVSPNSILRKYFDLMNTMYLVMGYISVPSKIHAEIRLSL